MTEEELLHIRHHQRLEKVPVIISYRRLASHGNKLNSKLLQLTHSVKYYNSFGCQDSCREKKKQRSLRRYGVAGNILY